MIAQLSNFTAAPTAPKSGIAPQELVGTVNFGLALGDAEASSGLAQGQELGTGDAVQSEGDTSALDFVLPTLDASAATSGNSLPSSGIGLPPELQAQPEEARMLTATPAPFEGALSRAGNVISAPEGAVQSRLETAVRPSVLSSDPNQASAQVNLSAPVFSENEPLAPANNPSANLSGKATRVAEPNQPVASVAPPTVQNFTKSEAEPGGATKQAGIDLAVKPPELSPAGPSQTGPREISAAGTTTLSAAPPPAAAQEAVSKAAAIAQVASARVPLRADLRPETGPSNLKAERELAGTQLRGSVSPVQPAVLPLSAELGEADIARSSQTPTPNLATSTPSALQGLQTSTDASSAPAPTSQAQAQSLIQSQAQSQAQPQAQIVTTPSAPQPSAQPPLLDTNGNGRLAAQIESTIEQLTETRNTVQSSRPELTVRHQEFGAITMRLEAMGNDLRATLSARDPGFVPAIQNALAERAVAASAETAGTSGQRGGDQGSPQSNSQSGTFSGSQGQGQGQGQGHGWHSEGRYGSSTGSGQGTSQPYSGQTDSRDEDQSSQFGANTGSERGQAGEGELFA